MPYSSLEAKQKRNITSGVFLRILPKMNFISHLFTYLFSKYVNFISYYMKTFLSVSDHF